MKKTKTKTCSECHRRKPVDAFHKNWAKKDGLQYWCRDCAVAYQKKYRQEHKVEVAERYKEYCHTINGYLRNCFGSMKQRCNNLKNKSYKNYGGRGIRCLFKSSQEFVDYVVNELKVDPRGLQIDRIDNDGHYEPGNIRFVTCKVNNNNRRDNK